MNTKGSSVGFSQTSAQQQSNMMSNLQHRREVATAGHNQQLLQLLTDEHSQLKKNGHHSLLSSARWSGITQLWQHITKLIHRSQLSVERQITATGEEWWYVEDPRSGKTFHAESFNVAMHWIEENRLGRR